MAKKRKKVSREGKKRVSEKISFLRGEGKDESAAVGEAFGMERSGRLGRHGAYRKKGRKGKRKSSRR